MEKVKEKTIPPGLASVAAGRDFITTEDFAAVTSRARNTVLRNFCTTGVCLGIRPIKIGRKLLWPVTEIASLLDGGGK